LVVTSAVIILLHEVMIKLIVIIFSAPGKKNNTWCHTLIIVNSILLVLNWCGEQTSCSFNIFIIFDTKSAKWNYRYSINYHVSLMEKMQTNWWCVKNELQIIRYILTFQLLQGKWQAFIAKFLMSFYIWIKHFWISIFV